MRHVDEGRLHAWLDGELPAEGVDGAGELERHLAACPVCRGRADEERRIRDEASAILGGAVPGSLATPRTVPLPADDADRVRRRDVGRRWVAIGWAASVLLALGIGWTMRPTPRAPLAADVPVRSTPTVEPVPATEPAPSPPSPPVTRDDVPFTAAPVVQETPSSVTPTSPTPVAAPPVATAPSSPARREPTPAPSAVSAEMAADVAPAAAPPAPPPPPAAAAPVTLRAAAPAEQIAATPAPPPPPPASAGGEAIVVRGRVTDRAGRGVSGAQVTVPGTPHRTVTAADGRYALVLADSTEAAADSLRVRATRIGMSAQTRQFAPTAADANTVDFALTDEVLSLEGLVVTGANASAPGAGVAWREVERDEAERRLGRSLVAVPELPLLGIELGKLEGRAAVRVRQQREDGSVLSLVQQRAPRARARSSRAEALRRAVEERGGWQIVLEEEGLVVEASEPVPADSLRRLSAPRRRP